MVDVSTSEVTVRLVELGTWLSDIGVGKSVVNNSVDDGEGVNVANGIRSLVGATALVSVTTTGVAA